MPTIAIDFDGVIHAYRRGWHDGTIYDEPVPGALDAITSLMEQHAVAIYTTRDVQQVQCWLENHGFGDVRTDLAWEPPFWNRTGALLVTNRKPAAVAYIDDRGIRFASWPQALADLAAASSRAGDASQAPAAAVIEITEPGRATDGTPGGSIVIPRVIRINGTPVLTAGGVKVHEIKRPRGRRPGDRHPHPAGQAAHRRGRRRPGRVSGTPSGHPPPLAVIALQRCRAVVMARAGSGPAGRRRASCCY